MAPQEASFFWVIDFAFSPKYRNLNPDEVAVAGRYAGKIENIDVDVDIEIDVDIIGFSPHIQKAKLIRIETQRSGTSYILRGVTQKDIRLGQVVTLPDTLQPKTTFLADVLFDERYEKIQQQPFQGLLRYSLHIYGADVFSTFTLPLGKTELLHGDQFSVKITLSDPLALEVGLQFGIGRFLGKGIITQILE